MRRPIYSALCGFACVQVYKLVSILKKKFKHSNIQISFLDNFVARARFDLVDSSRKREFSFYGSNHHFKLSHITQFGVHFNSLRVEGNRLLYSLDLTRFDSFDLWIEKGNGLIVCPRYSTHCKLLIPSHSI